MSSCALGQCRLMKRLEGSVQDVSLGFTDYSSACKVD